MEKCMIILLSLVGYWNCSLCDGLVGNESVSKRCPLERGNESHILSQNCQSKSKRSQILSILNNFKKKITYRKKVITENKNSTRLYFIKKLRKSRNNRNVVDRKIKYAYSEPFDYIFKRNIIDKREDMGKRNKSTTHSLKHKSIKKHKNNKNNRKNKKKNKEKKEKTFKIRITRIHRFKKSEGIKKIWKGRKEDKTGVMFEGIAAGELKLLQTLMFHRPEEAVMHFVEMAYRLDNTHNYLNTNNTQNTFNGNTHNNHEQKSKINSAIKTTKQKMHPLKHDTAYTNTLSNNQGNSKHCHMRLVHNIHAVVNVTNLFELQTSKVALMASLISEVLQGSREEIKNKKELCLRMMRKLVEGDDKIVASSLLLEGNTKVYSVSSSSGVSAKHVETPLWFRTLRCRHTQLCTPSSTHSSKLRENNLNNNKNLNSDDYETENNDGGVTNDSKNEDQEEGKHANKSNITASNTVPHNENNHNNNNNINNNSQNNKNNDKNDNDNNNFNAYWGCLESDCSLRNHVTLQDTTSNYQKSSSEVGVWTVAYAVAIHNSDGDHFEGVLKVDLDLTRVDLHECNAPVHTPFLFHLPHKCPSKTNCEHVPGKGFRRGSYRCVCNRKYNNLNNNNNTSTLANSNGSNNIIVNNNTDTKKDINDTSNSTSSQYLITPSKATYNDSNEAINKTLHKSLTPTNSGIADKSNTQKTSGKCSVDGAALERCFIQQLINKHTISQNSSNKTLNSDNKLINNPMKWLQQSSAANCSGCSVYTDDAGCLVGADEVVWDSTTQAYNYWMRGLPLGMQVFSLLSALTLAVLVARLRRNRVMKAGVWVLLEFITLGAIFLHSSVILAYFQPTLTSCIALAWLREIGFLLLYGSLFLKLHRTLSEFQSRKAHRVQLQDKDLVKALCFMLATLFFQMSAWTACLLDSMQQPQDLLIHLSIQPGYFLSPAMHASSAVLYHVCHLSLKDRLLEAGEMIFLAYSINVCYKVRKAPDDLHQNKMITFCILNEILSSVIYYSFRYFANSTLHPDVMLLALLLRCHLTASVVVVLEVCSKLWFTQWPPKGEPSRERIYSTAQPLDTKSMHSNHKNSIQAAEKQANYAEALEIDISNMRGEDIRYELRKLYTQLQIYKTKTMRQDNPHISKRRGGKKQPNRKFSFQNLHSKYKNQGSVSYKATTTPSGSIGGGTSMVGDHTENSTATAGGEVELSVRSPDESSNSIEGVSVYMDENSYVQPEANNHNSHSGPPEKKQNTLKAILSAGRNKSKRTD